MEWIKSIADWLFKSKTVSDVKLLQEIYRTAIDDLKKELAETKETIKEHRKDSTDNNTQLDEWAAREEKLHMIIIALMQENRNLKEELIFLKKEKK